MSVTVEDVRQLAKELPEVTEEPHHEMTPFRVHGKLLATVPDDHHLRVMLDESGIRYPRREPPRPGPGRGQPPLARPRHTRVG